MSSRLALGTAQFGLAYGVANRRGRVGSDEAREMLNLARREDVDTLDTAIAYGDSEARLGSFGVDDFKVVSKLPGVPPSCDDVATWVADSVRASLGRLRIARLYALLLHRPLELRGPQGEQLWHALLALKRAGAVEKLGVSIYGPNELEALSGIRDFDLIQAPLNVFDRRLPKSGWLSRLHSEGVEIHVRSAFLQGLLLMSPDHRPEQFDRWRDLFRAWDGWLKQMRVTPAQACLGFALAHREVARVVVGVDSRDQLAELLAIVEGNSPMPPDELSSDDLELIEPSQWGGV